jgi:hypothetical protein
MPDASVTRQTPKRDSSLSSYLWIDTGTPTDLTYEISDLKVGHYKSEPYGDEVEILASGGFVFVDYAGFHYELYLLQFLNFF